MGQGSTRSSRRGLCSIDSLTCTLALWNKRTTLRARGLVQPLASNRLTLCRSLHSPVHLLRNLKVHQVWSTFFHVCGWLESPSVPANLPLPLALSGFGGPATVEPWVLVVLLPLLPSRACSSLSSCPCSRLAQYLQGHTGNIPSLLAFDVLLGALQHVSMVHLSVGMSSGFTFLEKTTAPALLVKCCFLISDGPLNRSRPHVLLI